MTNTDANGSLATQESTAAETSISKRKRKRLEKRDCRKHSVSTVGNTSIADQLQQVPERSRRNSNAVDTSESHASNPFEGFREDDTTNTTLDQGSPQIKRRKRRGRKSRVAETASVSMLSLASSERFDSRAPSPVLNRAVQTEHSKRHNLECVPAIEQRSSLQPTEPVPREETTAGLCGLELVTSSGVAETGYATTPIVGTSTDLVAQQGAQAPIPPAVEQVSSVVASRPVSNATTIPRTPIDAQECIRSVAGRLMARYQLDQEGFRLHLYPLTAPEAGPNSSDAVIRSIFSEALNRMAQRVGFDQPQLREMAQRLYPPLERHEAAEIASTPQGNELCTAEAADAPKDDLRSDPQHGTEDLVEPDFADIQLQSTPKVVKPNFMASQMNEHHPADDCTTETPQELRSETPVVLPSDDAGVSANSRGHKTRSKLKLQNHELILIEDVARKLCAEIDTTPDEFNQIWHSYEWVDDKPGLIDRFRRELPAIGRSSLVTRLDRLFDHTVLYGVWTAKQYVELEHLYQHLDRDVPAICLELRRWRSDVLDRINALQLHWTEEEKTAFAQCLHEFKTAHGDKAPIVWHDISATVSTRTPKECEQYWTTMSRNVRDKPMQVGPLSDTDSSAPSSKPKSKKYWAGPDVDRLQQSVQQFLAAGKVSQIDWQVVATDVVTHSARQCKKKWLELADQSTRRSRLDTWTDEDDQRLIAIVSNAPPRRTSGHIDWAEVALRFDGLRDGSQCKQEWQRLRSQVASHEAGRALSTVLQPPGAAAIKPLRRRVVHPMAPPSAKMAVPNGMHKVADNALPAKASEQGSSAPDKVAAQAAPVRPSVQRADAATADSTSHELLDRRPKPRLKPVVVIQPPIPAAVTTPPPSTTTSESASVADRKLDVMPDIALVEMMDALLACLDAQPAADGMALEDVFRQAPYSTAVKKFTDAYGTRLCARRLLPLRRKVHGHRSMAIATLIQTIRDRLQHEIETGDAVVDKLGPG